MQRQLQALLASRFDGGPADDHVLHDEKIQIPNVEVPKLLPRCDRRSETTNGKGEDGRKNGWMDQCWVASGLTVAASKSCCPEACTFSGAIDLWGC